MVLRIKIEMIDRPAGLSSGRAGPLQISCTEYVHMYMDDVGRRMYGGDVYLYCYPDYSLACFSRRLVTILRSTITACQKTVANLLRSPNSKSIPWS